jgi:hypothetical protein
MIDVLIRKMGFEIYISLSYGDPTEGSLGSSGITKCNTISGEYHRLQVLQEDHIPRRCWCNLTSTLEVLTLLPRSADKGCKDLALEKATSF